jgi:hypothetical protein
MSLRSRILVVAFLAVAPFLAPNQASGVIIFLKGREAPLRGYLVDENDFRVIVLELLPGGGTREQIVTRASIDDLIDAVDRDRLGQLRPEDPEAYRDYAEELSEKREDPDAHVTALRLYLIAAHLEPQTLGRSCLLGMAALARSPAEERRYRGMAYLLDAKHDPALLQPPATARVEVEGLTEVQVSALRNLFRLLRTRETRKAYDMLSRPSIQAALQRVDPWIGRNELEEAAAPDSLLSVSLLRKILALELLLSGGSPAATEEGQQDTRPWSQIIARGGNERAVSLNLRTITEFDPDQLYYHDGEWVAERPREPSTE